MMTSRTVPLGMEKESVRQRALDYLALSKPRVVLMVLAVTLIGFYMGSAGDPGLGRLAHVLVGIGFAAGGTLALNQYMEREQDALMVRTQLRPLPDGRLRPLAALRSGLIITVAGLGYLVLFVTR